MPQEKRYIRPESREKLIDLHTKVAVGIRFLKGGTRGKSRLDQPALQPGYDQALYHLERAEVWLEEMNFLIEREAL